MIFGENEIKNIFFILREIADYIDSIGKKTGFARIVGSSGGIIAGSLTIAGGVMTVMTAGAAAPVLVAGAGIGLASGYSTLYSTLYITLYSTLYKTLYSTLNSTLYSTLYYIVHYTVH